MGEYSLPFQPGNEAARPVRNVTGAACTSSGIPSENSCVSCRPTLAAITEAYLYRYFASKDERYHAAVHEPVERLIDDFDDAIDELTSGGAITGAELVGRLNELMLRFMVAAVPYLGVALFSDLTGDDSFYRSSLYPRVYGRTREVLAAIDGWPGRRVELDVLNRTMWSLTYVTQLYLLGTPQFRPSASRLAK